MSRNSELLCACAAGAILLIGGVADSEDRARVSPRASAPLTAGTVERVDQTAGARATAGVIAAEPASRSPSAHAPAPSPAADVAANAFVTAAGKPAGRPALQQRDEWQEARRAARRIEKIRASAERRLAPLFAKLDLTPEQRERLTQLVMNDHEAAIDYAAANARLGRDLTASPDEYRDAGQALRQQLRADIRSLLGEDGYAAFLANDLAGRQTALVEHLQGRLAATNEPLTDQQGDQLTALLRARNTFRVGEDMIVEAQKFLSPVQLDALRAERARQQAGVNKPPVQRAIRENRESPAGP